MKSIYITVYPYDFIGLNFNRANPSGYAVFNCMYSDYNLAVEVANKLTQEQVEKVRAYNEENNTDYELPVFKIEHDKKSN